MALRGWLDAAWHRVAYNRVFSCDADFQSGRVAETQISLRYVG
jgi:hypothetical protein